MATLLQSHRVLYQCRCDEIQSLYSLFYCRFCLAIRCHSCASEEIDALFCPHCLESNTAGEARLKRNACVNCNQCPVCETVLTARTTDGTNVHLTCNVCRWSTKESDIVEHTSASNWPIYESTLALELSQVTEKMRGLEAAAKASRDQEKSVKRRSGPSSYLMADRFGLQAMIQKRKMAMEKPLPAVPAHEPIEEIPPIDFDLINSKTMPAMESVIRQPAIVERQLRPVRVPLKARKSVRCKHCDHNLAKLDFGPCVIKYKIHYFARDDIPEIRLSREPMIVPGDDGFAVFLTVTNHSDAKTELLLLPDPDLPSFEWITPMVQLLLPPPKDDADDSYDSHRVPESGESVVFRRGHAAAIRIEVKKTGNSEDECWLGVLLKFKNELLSKNQEQPEWHLTRVRIQLQA